MQASPTTSTTPARTSALTEAQNGLWYAQRLDPANPIFNTGHVIEIDGALNLATFVQAADQALAEADVLTLRFIDDPAEGPRQQFDATRRARLQVIDLQDQPDPHAAALAAITAEQNTAVDPTHDTLAAFKLFVLAPARHLWFQRVHHLLADGYGMLLIENRVAELYAARVAGSDAGTPFAPYASVLTEDAAYRASDKRGDDQAWWRAALTPLPEVVGLAEGNPVSAPTWLRSEAELPQRLVDQLKARADRANLAWPDLLTVLTAAYLGRHTGRASNVVGVPFMGRLGSVSARVPCMAMNVLPVAVALDEDAPLEDSLAAIGKHLRQARRHGRYRSEQLRRDLGLLGGQRRLHGPLINVLPFDAPMALPGLATRRQVLSTGPVEDLTITFRANATTGALLLTLDANPTLYAQADIDAHHTRLGHFLAQAVSAESLRGVPTLTADEHRHWLYGVNATAHPVAATTLTALIEQTFARTPDAPAVDDGEQVLSYAELDALSAALARQLQQAGVRRGDRVAVMLPRSVELVLALVATLRCGAAYLPLDATHPPERLATIAASAQPRVVLAHGAWHDRLPVDVPQQAIDLPALRQAAAQNGGALPREAPGPFDAAYVIYTSGSTGTPKGVVVEHDAIVNRLQWMDDFYGIGADERILQKTPATFDVSVWEFFLPLLRGATLVVAPPEAHKDPAWLARLMREQRITTLHFVPSMLAAFLAEPAAQGLAPRRVFCSGEALPAALRDRFHEVLSAELHNLYGPTEAAVDVSYWDAGVHDTALPVPIGRPVWNTALYVLDDHLRPVPPGVTGHLYLAGRQLARGYLGRDDLTAARFVPNPFTADAAAQGGDPACHGERMYATGDLARWRTDGAVVYLGRSDHQVKIRGLRIELDEIEHVLATAPGVAKLAVIAREDTPGDARIVAYVAPAPGHTPDADALRALAAQHLPDYMVPSAFVFLDDLPVTANGKLDRAALPAPAFAARASRAPATPREAEVAALFAQVLQRTEPIGADDDFFALGGHSLLAARVMAALREGSGLALGLGALFEHPTVERLAAWLDTQAQPADDHASDRGEAGFGPVLTLQQPTEAPARQRPALFCVHPAGGLGWCYGALGRALAPARPVYGLQARALDTTAAAPDTLEAMARDYVDTLLALQPQGPYHLAGWSVGGIVAQAMAVELRARGHAVGVLALLDAYPADVWRDRPEPEENAALKALLLIAGYDPAELQDVPLEREAVIGFLRASGHPLGELSDTALRGVLRVVENNNRLVRGHHHQRYDGDVLYFRAALDHAGTGLTPAMWQPYAGHIEVHDVPSLHAHLTGAAAVARIAPVLNRSLG
ncbi:MAG: Dimodular nonribosomal peptide synthase [Paracidovorax wautersii]|uniref:Dimodular nonribosomal peptide synthase n=1 Tax=Paracidovorax wautersii TaxID=1177982 RepID=A0A7V8FRS9_9BURK|nr:MAG: Dimodular nonribosomal peptide synthase [Paracidovorax wautersii]